MRKVNSGFFSNGGAGPGTFSDRGACCSLVGSRACGLLEPVCLRNLTNAIQISSLFKSLLFRSPMYKGSMAGVCNKIKKVEKATTVGIQIPDMS